MTRTEPLPRRGQPLTRVAAPQAYTPGRECEFDEPRPNWDGKRWQGLAKEHWAGGQACKWVQQRECDLHLLKPWDAR